MSVRTKLNTGYILIFVIFFISLIVALQRFYGVGEKVTTLVDESVEEMVIGKEIQRAIASQGMYLRAYYLDASSKNLEQLEHYNELLIEQSSLLTDFPNDSETTALIDELNGHVSEITDVVTTAISAIENKQTENALLLINQDFTKEYNDIITTTSSLLELLVKEFESASTNTEKAVLKTMNMMIITIIVVALLITFLMIFVKRDITTPLNRLSKQAKIIATGDLTDQDFLHKGKDEIGALGDAFNAMKKHLKHVLHNVNQSTKHLTSSSQQLVTSTEEVSAASEEVANKVNLTAELATHSTRAAIECTAAMDETSSGVQRISESTQDLLQNAMNMNDEAKEGVQIVDQAQSQMNIIYESTAHISDVTNKLTAQTEEITQITHVITTITEQTNLLALNAAIEAARAGEQGKGFAVVADEVRKLAEQSKISAEKIVSLTKQIQEGTHNVEIAVTSGLASVNKGVKMIDHAGTAFEKITHTIHTVTAQVQEISAASEEISASAEQVTASISEMAIGSKHSSENVEAIASVTEEQTATMHHIHAISQSLSENATDLQQLVDQFKV
jgi:methyl-accepting chemotaxis protein